MQKETHTINVDLGVEHFGFATTDEAEAAYDTLCDRVYELAQHYKENTSFSVDMVVSALLKDGLHPGMLGSMLRSATKDLFEDGQRRFMLNIVQSTMGGRN